MSQENVHQAGVITSVQLVTQAVVEVRA